MISSKQARITLAPRKEIKKKIMTSTSSSNPFSGSGSGSGSGQNQNQMQMQQQQQQQQQQVSAGGGGALSDLEKEVLDEYAKLLGNINHVCQISSIYFFLSLFLSSFDSILVSKKLKLKMYS